MPGGRGGADTAIANIAGGGLRGAGWLTRRPSNDGNVFRISGGTTGKRLTLKSVSGILGESTGRGRGAIEEPVLKLWGDRTTFELDDDWRVCMYPRGFQTY